MAGKMDKTTSRLFVPSTEGHVGNLKKMTTAQLIEMARRQESLLKKRGFLKSMPDKGERIKTFLDTLRQEISTREQNGPSSKIPLTKGSNLVTDNNLITKSHPESEAGKDSNSSACEQDNHMKSCPSEGSKMSAVGESELICCAENEKYMPNVEERELETTFQGLALSDSQDNNIQQEVHKPQFQIALERAEENKCNRKEELLLYKTLKVEHIEDLPQSILDTKPAPPKVKAASVKSKVPVAEESAVCPPMYKYSQVKTIPVTEALDLQQQQRQRQETLQAQLAAEKLSERLNIRMEPYNPEGVDMSYRLRKDRYGVTVDSDDDSDEAEDVDGDDAGYKMNVSDTED